MEQPGRALIGRGRGKFKLDDVFIFMVVIFQLGAAFAAKDDTLISGAQAKIAEATKWKDDPENARYVKTLQDLKDSIQAASTDLAAYEAAFGTTPPGDGINEAAALNLKLEALDKSHDAAELVVQKVAEANKKYGQGLALPVDAKVTKDLAAAREQYEKDANPANLAKLVSAQEAVLNLLPTPKPKRGFFARNYGYGLWGLGGLVVGGGVGWALGSRYPIPWVKPVEPIKPTPDTMVTTNPAGPDESKGWLSWLYVLLALAVVAIIAGGVWFTYFRGQTNSGGASGCSKTSERSKKALPSSTGGSSTGAPSSKTSTAATGSSTGQAGGGGTASSSGKPQGSSPSKAQAKKPS